MTSKPSAKELGGEWVDNPRAFRPFTINRKTNAEMTDLILKFYKGNSGKAVDITYGAGSFWRKIPSNWELVFYDKEPLNPICIRAEWVELPQSHEFDAVFYDPPYLNQGKGGFELNQASGYKRMERWGETAKFTERMKYGGQRIDPSILKGLLKVEGIVVMKAQELENIEGFALYDYLIQNNGFQPDGFKLTKPKARPNHAFWMIHKEIR